MKIDTSAKKIKELLNRSIEKVYPSKEKLKQVLMSGKRLRVYFGVDPTAPFLHLDHATNLLILKRFQELGHEVILLVGDFTARIGDPSGKVSPRRQLLKKEVIKNYKDYKKQSAKILDFNRKENPAKIVFNSEWFEKMKVEELIGLMSKLTVGRIIVRDMFQERIKKGKEIYLHEFLYPLLQGYDSVALNVDVEIGGTDQTFNMLIGRDLLKIFKGKEKFIITKKLLEDPKTGKFLMSKSEGRYIALNDSPFEMYGKIMKLPDEVLVTCFQHWTEIKMSEIAKIEKGLNLGELNPKKAKQRLAREVVTMYYNKRSAMEAEKEFNRVFREKKLPSKIKKLRVKEKNWNILELLKEASLIKSKSEGKRLIRQKGVKIEGKVQKDWREKIKIKKGMIIQIGKRRIVKLV